MKFHSVIDKSACTLEFHKMGPSLRSDQSFYSGTYRKFYLSLQDIQYFYCIISRSILYFMFFKMQLKSGINISAAVFISFLFFPSCALSFVSSSSSISSSSFMFALSPLPHFSFRIISIIECLANIVWSECISCPVGLLNWCYWKIFPVFQCFDLTRSLFGNK